MHSPVWRQVRITSACAQTQRRVMPAATVITPPSERVFELYVPVVAGVSVDTSREAEPVEAGYRAYGGYAAAG